MIVKILNQKTKDFDLYECVSASVKRDITDNIDLDNHILEDDIGVFDIDETFPMFLSNASKGVAIKCGKTEMQPSFTLLSLKLVGQFKNIVVDTTIFDVFILENGKTVDRI